MKSPPGPHVLFDATSSFAFPVDAVGSQGDRKPLIPEQDIGSLLLLDKAPFSQRKSLQWGYPLEEPANRAATQPVTLDPNQGSQTLDITIVSISNVPKTNPPCLPSEAARLNHPLKYQVVRLEMTAELKNRQH